MIEENLAIEVGPRNNPSILSLPDSLLQGDTFIYVDKRQDPGLRRAVEKLKDQGKNLIVQGDGSKLPVSDNSTGVIYSRDLFGSQGTTPHLSDRGYIEGETENVGNIDEIANEWFRVTAPGGKAIIAEWSTPNHAPFDKVDNAFKNAGYVREEEDIYRRGEQFLLNKDALPVLGDMSRQQVADKFYQTFEPNSYTVIYTKPK